MATEEEVVVEDMKVVTDRAVVGLVVPGVAKVIVLLEWCFKPSIRYWFSPLYASPLKSYLFFDPIWFN